MGRQIFDMFAVDGSWDYGFAIIHGNMANHSEPGAATIGKFANARGPWSSAQHQNAPLEAFTAKHIAKDQSREEQGCKAQPHRVKRIGSPQCRIRQDKIDNRQKNDTE